MRSAHIVVVTGGRDYSLTKEDRRALRGLLKALRVRTLIHGDARGVDRACGEVADKLGLEVRVRPADWDRHGRAAGAIRNREMLVEALATRKPVALVAFPGGRGTENCRNQAKSMNICIASVRGEGVTWEIHGEQGMTTKKKTKKAATNTPAVPEVLTPEVMAEVQQSTKKSKSFARKLEGLEPDQAAEMLPKVQRNIRELTKAKDSITKPLKQALKAATDFFKTPIDAWEEVKAELKEIIKRGVIAERKEQKKMLKEGLVVEAQTMPVIPAHTGSVQRLKIVNAAEVPKKWKIEIIDEKALLAAKKENPKLKVPGIKFWTETTVRAR